MTVPTGREPKRAQKQHDWVCKSENVYFTDTGFLFLGTGPIFLIVESLERNRCEKSPSY